MKILVICLLFFSFTATSFAQMMPKQLVDKSVRFIYLVSKDRKLNPAYQKAIEMAAKNIQGWYKKQLNGATFKLNSPVVEVAYSDKNANFFYDNPNGKDKKNWGYNNTFDEGSRLVGAKHFDEKYIWVIYSDGPGNSGMGGSGVCIMPEDDLLGLIGKHPEQPEINRWIAGLGHEVGHAFGLPHPADIEKDADAIMWTGIYGGKYPDVCYLTAQDKEILQKSPFFFDEKGSPLAGTLTQNVAFSYPAGKFTRYENEKNKEKTWTENTTEGNTFKFIETSETGQYYYLKAINRNLEIRIPVRGGQSHISTDGGNVWRIFQIMKK